MKIVIGIFVFAAASIAWVRTEDVGVTIGATAAVLIVVGIFAMAADNLGFKVFTAGDRKK